MEHFSCNVCGGLRRKVAGDHQDSSQRRKVAGDHQDSSQRRKVAGDHQDSSQRGKNAKEGLLSSVFLVVQNVVMLVLSIPMLVMGILLALKDKECATFMDKPVIAVGALLMLLPLMGLCTAFITRVKECKRADWIPFAQLIIMFCLVILLFCFAIFALEITNSNLAHHVTNSNNQTVTEYRLYEYPKWTRRSIERGSYWNGVKQCLISSSSSVCGPGILPGIYSNISSAPTSLTPVQGGCCKPPSACNFTFLGSTTETQEPTKRDIVKSTMVARSSHVLEENKRSIETQINNANEIADRPVQANMSSFHSTEDDQESAHETIHAYTHDCSRWNNLPNQLCFDCDTCKAGVIQSSMNHWRPLGKMYVVLVMIMVVLYAILACYGFQRSNKSKENTSNKTKKTEANKFEKSGINV